MDSTTICKIRDIMRSIAAIEQELELQHGLNLNEAMLLCSLSEVESLKSGELAERLALRCSNCSKVISSAERKGLVNRQLGEIDKRQSFVSLTPLGYERLAQVKATHLPLPEFLQ